MNEATALFFTDGDSDVGSACARILAANPVNVLAVIQSKPSGPMPWGELFHNPALLTVPPDMLRLEAHTGFTELLVQGVDYLFSCWYDRRVPAAILQHVRKAAVNLHPAYLPFNRGRHSTFWGLLDEAPLGATMHHMDEGLDTGDIIAQEALEDDGVMPAQEVYLRQSALCVKLFREWLPRVLDGSAPRRPQGQGTYHKADDIRTATMFEADRMVTMRQLVRLARATSFGEHGFHVRLPDGRTVKIKARVELA